MPRSVYAIATDHRTCLASLRAAGFRSDEISLLSSSGDEGSLEPAADGRRSSTGVAWLPVVGAVLACGPLALLLRGAQGIGIAKPLSELGVPTYAATRYEDALTRGAAVVAVHTDNGYEIDTLAELLRDGGCELVAAA